MMIRCNMLYPYYPQVPLITWYFPFFLANWLWQTGPRLLCPGNQAMRLILGGTGGRDITHSSASSSLYLFIYFLFILTLFTVDLKLLIDTHKKSLYSLYSNNIELIDSNSGRTSWQTHTHICTHIHQRSTQGNASFPVQRVFWCSLYKSYMLHIYFTKPARTLQRHPFFNFSFKNA